MKKFTIVALAICLAFALAAPVMAVDADFSGAYRVRGSYVSHWDLSTRSASQSFMNMRFRLQTVFKVSDILSVTTRFDALDDQMFGEAVSAGNELNFDRAYMTIKSGIGDFNIGRMAGGGWGTTFLDTVSDYDRIKWNKTFDNLTLWLVFQKNTESDYALGTANTERSSVADLDSETYYFLAKYKMENTTSGLLLAFTNDKTSSSKNTKTYATIPYFVSKFGPLAIQGELAYKWGQTAYDTTGSADLDIKKLAYNLEATYSFGPASVMAGYAFLSGDNNTSDSENGAYGNVGGDWEKLFILTTNEIPALKDLGGVGNLSGDGSATNGAKIMYGGATFSPLDNLKVGFVIGKADADELASGNSKDDFGVEYDFTLNWKIYDNLTYTAIAAFLSAGDLYKEQGSIDTADFDDTYALFHQLQLSF